MKKSEILKGRRELSKICGKGEYLFFTSILLSAAALCLIAVLAVDSLMRVPEISEAYGSMIPAPQIFSDASLPFYVQNALAAIGDFLLSAAKALPTTAVFIALFLFVVCPIYQGTVRWCAYLIEEGKSLPIRAILFYFLSPKFYFPCVWLSIKIFFRKVFAGVAFLFLPFLCIYVSLWLGTDYYGQNTLAAATLILSAAWFVLALALFFIYLEKYSAVRYLFALGFTRKLFKSSAQITEEKRGWLFFLRLRLMLNLPLAFGIVTAPMAFSRIISGNCLAIKSLIFEKRQTAQTPSSI